MFLIYSINCSCGNYITTRTTVPKIMFRCQNCKEFLGENRAKIIGKTCAPNRHDAVEKFIRENSVNIR